jgi:hypothetical protein
MVGTILTEAGATGAAGSVPPPKVDTTLALAILKGAAAK